jgi:hypothetical protein
MYRMQTCNLGLLPYCQPGVFSQMKYAHAYVPFQCLSCIYPPMKGLSCGTIFPELNSPYGTDPEYTVDA